MKTNLTIKLAALAFVAAPAAALFFTPEPASARIKLATLPKKENVQVRFDHPQLVMVEEERVISLQKGTNTVDFSWAGTTIDKSSIVFRAADPATPVTINSTSYPPGENALTWSVTSPDARSEKFRISYLMGSIDRETSYQVVVAPDEKSAVFKHYFKITNNSGENFTDTNFITAAGQSYKRDIEFREAKRMLARSYTGVALKKEYVFDRNRNHEAILNDFVFDNKQGAGLGQTPFDYGKVRVYLEKKPGSGGQEDGGGTTFLGEDWGKFTPIGEEMRVNIGTVQDIKVERKLFAQDKQNVRGNVADYDEWVHIELKNFKAEPVVVKVIERIDGEWELRADTNANGEPVTIGKRESNEEVHFFITVPPTVDPLKPHIFKLHYVRKNVW